jgi:hypothetical protein
MRLVPKKKRVCRAKKFIYQTKKIMTSFIFLHKKEVRCWRLEVRDIA